MPLDTDSSIRIKWHLAKVMIDFMGTGLRIFHC